jgi:hypothetical protein
MQTEFRQQVTTEEAQTAWELDTDQMLFMLQHHNAIEVAYEQDDLESLARLEQSKV